MMDVGTRQLLYQMSGRWLLEEQPTTARPGSFSVTALTFVIVTKHFRQKATSISKATSRRRCSMPLLRKSNMIPELGNMLCFCVSCVLRRRQLSTSCGVIHGSLRRQARPARYAVRRSDGGHESCWACIWAWADVFHNQEGN